MFEVVIVLFMFKEKEGVGGVVGVLFLNEFNLIIWLLIKLI